MLSKEDWAKDGIFKMRNDKGRIMRFLFLNSPTLPLVLLK